MSWLAQNFVFTGKAKLKGVDVTRAQLESYIQKAGGFVGSKVDYATDILVASRSDTTKAKAAVERGVRVCTYDEFFQMAGINHPSELGLDPLNQAQHDRERERAEAQERVEAKRQAAREAKERREAALDQAAAEIDGWGMF